MSTADVSQATMDLIQRAIAEDLAGGEDVTSVSTVDAKAVVGAPRWLYVANYLALGWAAAIYSPQMYRAGGLWVLLPILIGGLFYSVGAIFYALKRPGRYARYFGFHELFHIFVIAAWVSQYIGVSIAIYRAR